MSNSQGSRAILKAIINVTQFLLVLVCDLRKCEWQIFYFQFGGKAVKNQKYKYGNGVNGCTKLVVSAICNQNQRLKADRCVVSLESCLLSHCTCWYTVSMVKR